jgi:cysteinyl-tRNA synthetase
MSLAILGDGFDIHGGGDDLIFPHHENELAQAEASGHRFARYWLHNGMVNVDGEKMSKSLGNFTTLAELLDHHEPRAVRLLMLQTHYRRTMEIGHDALVAAAEGLKRLDSMHRRLVAAGLDVAAAPLDADAVARFDAAMDDDFSTPTAVEVIFGLVRRANQALDVDDDITAGSAGHTALQLADVLGLAAGDSTASAGEVDEIALSIGLRNQARAARDFAEADRIRDELAERGIILEDTADGTTWHRA